MKTFTDAQIAALAKDKRISSKEYMKILMTAKETVATMPKEVTDVAVLTEIRNVLALIASKIEPVKEMLPQPAPQVTVTMPKRGGWMATVAERDRDGFISKVTFREV